MASIRLVMLVAGMALIAHAQRLGAAPDQTILMRLEPSNDFSHHAQLHMQMEEAKAKAAAQPTAAAPMTPRPHMAAQQPQQRHHATMPTDQMSAVRTTDQQVAQPASAQQPIPDFGAPMASVPGPRQILAPAAAAAPVPAAQVPAAQVPMAQAAAAPVVVPAVAPPTPFNQQSFQPAPVQQQLAVGAPPGTPPVHAQQPVLQSGVGAQQEFAPRDVVVPPQAPPMNIPPDVQNQLIKFFGLDSFGIPGLTGNHPDGFAGAVQELRAAGIPVQGMPLANLNGQPQPANAADLLAAANPNFGLNTVMREQAGPLQPRADQLRLPDPKPGDNGLIGLLSSSIRKLVKESGVADALGQGLPSLLGTGATSAKDGTAAGASAADAKSVAAALARAAGGHSNAGGASFSHDDKTEEVAADGADAPTKPIVNSESVRRQQSATEKVANAFASALGAGPSNGPKNAGLPRIPGIPLLPGGIPRNAQGQIDVINLIGSITRRVSNGTTLADVLPPEQLQTLADNVTDALLPATPEDFDLNKFMGRWFEGVNSPRASEQRCVVHHYGGLTKNDKTATFTALKIYREGSEFGTVRYSIGYAFRAGNKDAMLQLHSNENSDAQPFWVYKLGPEGKDPFGNPQYEYAIVSNWVKYPVTVLVRDPDTFKAKYESEVMRWLEDQGFINGFIHAFNMLQPVSYSSCQYAENTFELFGR